MRKDSAAVSTPDAADRSRVSLDYLRVLEQKIDEATREVESFKKLYANPFVNVAFTFIEPFPVGLLMTLISAVTLRRK